MEKHTPYFKVLETLQKVKGCALCTLEKEAVHSYFDAFLYENVNNPVTRDVLRASHGYCPYHAHFLVGFHDALALSILYKEQALLAASFLEKNGLQKEAAAEWKKHGTCPGCLQALQIRKHYLGILLEGIAEREMREAFLDHFHVCLHHFLNMLDGLPDGEFKKGLVEKMRLRLEDLAGRLEQYCQDDQRIAMGERFESPHRHAWKEAVEIAVGQKDVFEPLVQDF